MLAGAPQPQPSREASPDRGVGPARAALETFDQAGPPPLPAPPPLAVRVTYALSASRPRRAPHARERPILVQRWQRVDEWWRRQDASREALSAMNRDEQSWLGRLGRWLRGQDDCARQRKRLSERLVELGELAPSQQAHQAKVVCNDVAAIATEVRGLVERGQTTGRTRRTARHTLSSKPRGKARPQAPVPSSNVCERRSECSNRGTQRSRPS